MSLSTTEERKETIRRVHLAAWNEGDFKLLESTHADGFVMHDPMGERDLDGLKEMIEQVRAGSDDLELRVDDLIAEGDRVVMRYTLGGTNTGPSFLTDEPTGETWEGSGISIYRLEDSAIAEQWDSFDYLGVMRQLGLVPSEHEE